MIGLRDGLVVAVDGELVASDLAHDDRDVVLAATLVRERDERLACFGHRRRAKDDVARFVGSDFVRQPIGAEEQTVVTPEIELPRATVTSGSCPMACKMTFRRGDLLASSGLIVPASTRHEALVLRHLADARPAHEVGARIADLGDVATRPCRKTAVSVAPMPCFPGPLVVETGAV